MVAVPAHRRASYTNARSLRASGRRDATERMDAEPMTSQGHAVSRFARAVKTGNPNVVVAAAAELPRLSLADALLVLLVSARARAPQTEADAVRWAARYVAEVRPAPAAHEAHLVLSAACALAGPCPAAGRGALHAPRHPPTLGRALPGTRGVGAARALRSWL
jgi:hypothetical protein